MKTTRRERPYNVVWWYLVVQDRRRICGQSEHLQLERVLVTFNDRPSAAVEIIVNLGEGK